MARFSDRSPFIVTVFSLGKKPIQLFSIFLFSCLIISVSFISLIYRTAIWLFKIKILMYISFNCPCVWIFSFLIACMYTSTSISYDPPTASSSIGGNEKCQLMVILGQSAGVNFHDVNTNSYDN